MMLQRSLCVTNAKIKSAPALTFRTEALISYEGCNLNSRFILAQATGSIAGAADNNNTYSFSLRLLVICDEKISRFNS
jgi:hypothetical protein